MRLGKYLAHAGVASRRGAEKIVFSGRVTVGGEVVTDPARDVDDSSGVAVDGSAVGPEPTEVWMLNKPKGVTSTAREPGRRRAVVDLVRSKRRLYPVGRLDVETTGLILLTNDGALANRLTHPRYEVPKTYRATLTRPPDDIADAAAAPGGDARGRADRARPGAAKRRPRDRDHPPRGPQPAGAAHGSRRSATGSTRSSGSGSARCSSATSPRATRGGSRTPR